MKLRELIEELKKIEAKEGGDIEVTLKYTGNHYVNFVSRIEGPVVKQTSVKDGAFYEYKEQLQPEELAEGFALTKVLSFDLGQEWKAFRQETFEKDVERQKRDEIRREVLKRRNKRLSL